MKNVARLREPIRPTYTRRTLRTHVHRLLALRTDAEVAHRAIERCEIAGLAQDQGSARTEVERVRARATAGSRWIRQHDLSRQSLIRGSLRPVADEQRRVAVHEVHPAFQALVPLGARSVQELDPSLSDLCRQVRAVAGRRVPG